MDGELMLKTTILEALIEKITSAQNKTANNTAVEAFTKIVANEPESAKIAVRLISSKIQSSNQWEIMQALYLLESCMPTSTVFQAEVGKFRFLNELIKLVSPKYLGNSSSTVTKNRITNLLKLWSEKFSNETKIKEAFEMLIKQGVVVEENNKWSYPNSPNVTNSNFAEPISNDEDEKKSQLLQKLLRSNKPNDLQAANHLIKVMVKEKEQRENLRLILNNAKLLSEMLSNASENTSAEDIELMKELKETCVNMKPTVANLISSCVETKDAVKLLELKDLLNDTLQLYHETMMSIKKPANCNQEKHLVPLRNISPTLLDFSSPIDEAPFAKTENSSTSNVDLTSGNQKKSEVNTLEEIFNAAYSAVDVSASTVESLNSSKCANRPATSVELFHDLNILGKSLLELNNRTTESPNNVPVLASQESTSQSAESVRQPNESLDQNEFLPSEDDELIDGDEITAACDIKISDDRLSCELLEMTNATSFFEQLPVEPLFNINVPLLEIKTDGNVKIPAFDDPNGISVYIQLAKNRPRNDISVFLVLSCSKKPVSITNFLFQPVIPKECRLKLQPPLKSDLPPYNPHIPIETIVQIMLIASLKRDSIPLKFVISYNEKGEMVTEMGEVPALPLR